MTVSSRLALVIAPTIAASRSSKTLESIYSDGYAGAEIIDVLVVANNCLDDTLVRLTEFRHAHLEARLRLSWVEEPQPGKSYALNTGIANTQHAVLCFIDDDQVVESGFISHLLKKASSVTPRMASCVAASGRPGTEVSRNGFMPGTLCHPDSPLPRV